MPVITIFSGRFCGENEIAAETAKRLGCELTTDAVLEKAAADHGAARDRLARAMLGAASVFNAFTHEKEKSLAYIQEALSAFLARENAVVLGPAAQLAPANIGHVLKVCLVADAEHRAKRAVESGAAKSKGEAQKIIKRHDMELTNWVKNLHQAGPWDGKLYDLKLPVNQISAEDAVAAILEQAGKSVTAVTDTSKAAALDFITASKVRVALAEAGHDVIVTCGGGIVEIVIDKYTLRLEQLEKELIMTALTVEGVSDVKTKVGPHFHEANIYRKQNFELPSKVLLVDDEKEFVQTLSERLQMRDFGTAVANTGEEAIGMAMEDEPEVMVLDLRMPGVDGMEVLERMKKEKPDVEIIILTGHGTDKDRELAMELGAFAYLEKPVDIEVLSRTMKEAYDHAKRKKEKRG